MSMLHTRWPVFGIRVTEANLRPDFGSVSPSWTDRGLKTGGYERLRSCDITETHTDSQDFPQK